MNTDEHRGGEGTEGMETDWGDGARNVRARVCDVCGTLKRCCPLQTAGEDGYRWWCFECWRDWHAGAAGFAASEWDAERKGFSAAMAKAMSAQVRVRRMDIRELAAPPAVAERMDKVPARALLWVGRVMAEGMKYEDEEAGTDDWQTRPPEYHLNRMLRHVAQHRAGDTSEDHVGHVMTRALMWGHQLKALDTDEHSRSALSSRSKG